MTGILSEGVQNEIHHLEHLNSNVNCYIKPTEHLYIYENSEDEG